MPGIDLHIHSTASDGTLTPTEIVVAAKAAGLEALALTDHDTVQGLGDFMEAGRDNGLEVIPGVELSVRSDLGTMDILGYWVPTGQSGLTEALEYLNLQRAERNREIAARLQRQGLDVSYEEIAAKAAGGTIGRPHIAQVLQEKGYVKTLQDAFEKYLASGGKAYVPKVVLSPDKAVAMLKAEGATVCLAHPRLYKKVNLATLEGFLARMKPLGLDGLEARYPEHSPEDTRNYENLAARLGLVVSGGSDFHGLNKPHLRLGKGRGDLYVPYSVLEGLKALRRSQGLPA
ncbi:PHP domain-containing protein [Desulfocurvibacter africanus]|uniref:PHP domain-containing protein n=1 Tax=Desulfocurvibacter africanus TaxID=873 RepID=UPI000426BD30|nr:PHP domain-containing protein [Desulfocurvibacter africanus]